MSNSGSAHFKHFQAEHINAITISSTSYYLNESDLGSIVFADYKANNVAINLHKDYPLERSCGINFKFIFNTNDGSISTNTITINYSINDQFIIFYNYFFK